LQIQYSLEQAICISLHIDC